MQKKIRNNVVPLSTYDTTNLIKGREYEYPSVNTNFLYSNEAKF